MWGETIAAMLNNNVHTYASGPVFTLMEKRIIEEMDRMVGWSRSDDVANGLDGLLFCPGGSYANLMAVLIARNKAFPHV